MLLPGNHVCKLRLDGGMFRAGLPGWPTFLPADYGLRKIRPVTPGNNPLSPPSAPVQRRLQGPPAKSKFLAVNLTHLRLWDNQLTTLPPEIGQLTNLTGLSLHGNQFTTLPPVIG